MPSTSPDASELATTLRQRWPELAPLLDEIQHLIARIHRACRQAEDAGSPLAESPVRSPSVDPGDGAAARIHPSRLRDVRPWWDDDPDAALAGRDSHADPTGDAVANAPAMPGNRAWRDIEAAQAATRIVRLHLERRLTDDDPDVARIYLDRLVTSLTDAAVRVERHIPNPEADLLRARSRDTPDDPGCPSCARGLDSQDRPIYSPSKRESRGACGLCGWCYHEVEKTAEHLGIPARTAAGDQRYWPIAKAVEAHSRGEMITAGKIRSWAKTIDRDEREREKRRAHKQKLKRRYGR